MYVPSQPPAPSTMTVDIAGRIAWVTMTRGDRGNTYGRAMADDLLAAALEVRAAGCPVMVLRSSGRLFSVGGDLGEFAAADDEIGALTDDLAHTLHRTVSVITRMDAIVVAAVAGAAAGAGVALAAAADIVLAAESASFTLAYTRAGLTPDGGSSLLTASLGLHRALYVALLNPTMTARDAQAAGLVAQTFADTDFDDSVGAVATALAAGSAPTMAATKHLFRRAARHSPEEQMELEAIAISKAAAAPDGRAGIAAFLAKQTPVFPSAVGRR
jgi:2-(1,2-epoxy-1,2-dihydrophenyl)acetyl-CoA isomerase